MAVFKKHIVTEKGAALLSRSLAGEGKFIFTKGAFGAGKYTGDISKLEELVDKRLDLPISNITYYKGAAVLNLQISNETVKEAFNTEELGLYAKIEGDEEEVLYSYTRAIKPDGIPDSSFIVTFAGDHEIYIQLTSEENVDVEIKDDNIYLTLRIGNREYVRTGCVVGGLLSVQTELIKNGQYQADDKKWYINIGETRIWKKSGIPDSLMKPITFLQHEEDLKRKQDEEDSRLLTKAKKIWEAINELFNSKLEKDGYTGTAKKLSDEISKLTSKTILGRIIIGKGLSVDSTGKTSVVSKNDGITVNENDVQLNTVDNLTTASTTKPLSANQGKKLDENKQNKTDSILKTTAKSIVGAINELFSELWKTASTTAFGRIKVGKNLSIDANGFLNGAAPYTHPTGNGNTHLPAGGASGQFIKWLSAGVGQWVKLTKADISDFAHTHTKSQITDFAHTHDDRYFTETEINNLLNKKANTTGTYTGITAGYTNIVNGAYTGNGGQQPPSYISSGKVRFNMMNTPINGDSDYKDFLLMDTYSGGDVPYVTAFGISKSTALKAFLMQGSKNGTKWDRTAELWHSENLKFGTNSKQILEGSKLAETLGIPYGGSLNNTNAKTVGTAYYDSTTKKTYKCTVANSLNYADASKFEAISNNDLLTKLQNFSNQKLIWSEKQAAGNITLKDNISNFKFISFTVQRAQYYNNLLCSVQLFKTTSSGLFVAAWYDRGIIVKHINDTTINLQDVGGSFLHNIIGFY